MSMLMLSLGCCLLQAAAGEGGPHLCVMTYNIHHGEGRDGKLDLDRIAGIIRQANPDIVCLQEIDRNLPRTNHLDFCTELSKRLGMPAVFYNNYAFDGGEYGNATLTRLEIVSRENIPLPTPQGIEPRGCLKVTVRTDAGLVQVLNTHLGLNADERRQQAEAILQHIENVPTLLAGDFNEGITQPALTLLLTRFKDLLTQAGVPARRNLHARIDHILASPHFTGLAGNIVTTPETAVASDHLPCVTQLQLPMKGAIAEAEGVYDTDDERVTDALRGK